MARVAVRGGTKAGRDRGLPGLNNHREVAATMALGRLISAVITLLNEVNLEATALVGGGSASQH